MEENQGIAHIFGLSTVLLGLCFIMSMGVYSANNPYKPGENIKCTVNECIFLKFDSFISM